MFDKAAPIYDKALQDIREAGLWKEERVILSAQGPEIQTDKGRVLNFCANNYLGLSAHPAILKASHDALDSWGYGLSSVRFICGTQQIHEQLERAIASFLGMEDTILYSSCFDANGGVFETLLTEHDAVISDELNHASIIDGVRLCKAERHRYPNGDMRKLEEILRSTANKRVRLIVTDGVFSMDGLLAPLDKICDLADRYGAMVMVDDSHATGFIGAGGRGTHEHFNVMGRVDILSGTLGKALGGASGGYIASRKSVTSLLRQRSRPYLFSNTLAPIVAAASLAVFDIMKQTSEHRERLMRHAKRFRETMSARGFNIPQGIHPIVPVMIGEGRTAIELASRVYDQGVYVIGFVYPVVPKGKARIRVQLSAAHTDEHVDHCIDAFTSAAKAMGIV